MGSIRRRVTSKAKALGPFIAGKSGGVVREIVDTGVISHGDLLGLEDDDHTQYYRVDGTRAVAGHVLPALPDTYDLGSPTQMFRKGWLSELDAVLFAQNTVTLVGGWLVVGKNEGTFPADVAAADTQIDFGQAMTVGHFVLMRAALQVEYMQIGTLVSGTTYNVTRDLDGTGANDWAAGTPYSVLGTTGDGRIELNAYDTPRISVIRQGATYNAQTEMARIGDLNGSFGVAAERYGIALGDYANGNYLKYDPTDGLVLKAGNGNLSINDDGISLLHASDYNEIRSFGFRTSGGVLRVGLSSWDNEVPYSISTRLGNETPAGMETDIVSIAVDAKTDTTGGTQARARLTASRGIDSHGFTVGHDNGTFFAEVDTNFTVGGNLSVEGAYRSYKNSTDYTGYIFVPLTSPLTSTAWDGDARSTTAKTLIDLSAVFGIPAGVKAVSVKVSMRDSGSAAGNAGIILGPTNGNFVGKAAQVSGIRNDAIMDFDLVVPCDANGDLYYQTFATGASTLDVWIEIWGYWL